MYELKSFRQCAQVARISFPRSELLFGYAGIVRTCWRIGNGRDLRNGVGLDIWSMYKAKTVL